MKCFKLVLYLVSSVVCTSAVLSSRVVSGKGLTVKELKPVKKLSPNVMGVNQDRRVYDKTFELNVFTATGRVFQGSVEFSGKGNSLKLP